MAGDQDEPLDLTDDQVFPDDDAPPVERQREDDEQPEGEDGDTVIGFADEVEGEEDEQPLVKKLRDEIRSRDRKLAEYRRSPPAANDADPEPAIPDVPDIEAFDYDKERFDAAVKARDTAVSDHAEWKHRQKNRDDQRSRVAEEQARQIEQQRKALGVSDYEDRAAAVKERFSDSQIAILTNGAQNPARLIYALGRSPAKLDQLAAEDNLARFAVMLGALEKDIKVTKRNAPAVDTPMRGATASSSLKGAEKHLEKLEKEAERTGDRTELRKYRQQLRMRAA